jgi:hypothetical protein
MNSLAERFRELARALRWQPGRLVAMLWAYFDESGLHKAGGELDWLVLGGGMATCENWERLSVEWEEVLKDFGIAVFHMADFESNHGEFKDWTVENHRALLNRLLDIQAEYVPEIFGVTNWTGRYREGFRQIYQKDVIDVMTVAASNIAPKQTEPISLMFAAHPDYAASNVIKCFDDVLADNTRIKTCTIGKPSDYPPLQAADMIVYELSRSIRDGRPLRYPYVRMKERAKNLTLWLLI